MALRRPRLDLRGLDTPENFQKAARAELHRIVEVSLRPTRRMASPNDVMRRKTEIREMVQRVTADAKASGRGHVWHLLAVLDWEGDWIAGRIAENERQFRGDKTVGGGAMADRVHAQHRTQLRRALTAYQSAQPALEWAAKYNAQGAGAKQEHARCVLSVEAAAGLAALGRALQAVERVDLLRAEAESWRKGNRRHDHVRASALQIVRAMLGLGATWQVDLARYIVEVNSAAVAPCPSFATKDVRQNVRTILQRGAVTG
jgi:hypothetical protein